MSIQHTVPYMLSKQTYFSYLAGKKMRKYKAMGYVRERETVLRLLSYDE